MINTKKREGCWRELLHSEHGTGARPVEWRKSWTSARLGGPGASRLAPGNNIRPMPANMFCLLAALPPAPTRKTKGEPRRDGTLGGCARSTTQPSRKEESHDVIIPPHILRIPRIRARGITLAHGIDFKAISYVEDSLPSRAHVVLAPDEIVIHRPIV